MHCYYLFLGANNGLYTEQNTGIITDTGLAALCPLCGLSECTPSDVRPHPFPCPGVEFIPLLD